MTDSKWVTIYIPSKYIKTRTASFTQIIFPESSVYMGYQTWLSNKLVKCSGDYYRVALRSDFDINIEIEIKNTLGNYEIVSNSTISARTFQQQFSNYSK